MSLGATSPIAPALSSKTGFRYNDCVGEYLCSERIKKFRSRHADSFDVIGLSLSAKSRNVCWHWITPFSCRDKEGSKVS